MQINITNNEASAHVIPGLITSLGAGANQDIEVTRTQYDALVTWIAASALSIAIAKPTYQNVLYVNKAYAGDYDPAGTEEAPYLTIGAALTAIGAAAAGAGVWNSHLIYVMSNGTPYLENLTIPNGRKIVICAIGAVLIGDGATPTGEGDITFAVTAAGSFASGNPELILTSIADTYAGMASHVSTMGIIVGRDIIITSDTQNMALDICNTRVVGKIDTTGIGTGILYTTLKHAYIGGDFAELATTAKIMNADHCNLHGDVFVNSYGRFDCVDFDGNITIITGTAPAIMPIGFYGCNIAATLTAPGEVLVDEVTRYLFWKNGGTLAGGAFFTTMSRLKDNVVDAVVTAADIGGGGTATTLVVQLNTMDGRPISSVREVMIYANDTQYIEDANANVTFSLATAGAIVASGAGWCLARTSATGAFACTLTNAVDETVWFNAKTAPYGVAVLAEACVVRGCLPDDATWA